MGNIYTVGPNEALVVSGMYIITLLLFSEAKLQLIYSFLDCITLEIETYVSHCQLSTSFYFFV